MGISLNCFTAALGTFTPSPADITHPEVLARKIADWTNPQRLIAKTSASRFHLEPAEHTVFNDWWELAEPARELLDRGHNRDGTGEIDAEIRRAFVRLAAIVNDKARYDEPGYRHVRRVSGSDRFVIFSDHHMAFPGSRQDFFRTSGNRELYAEILTEYAECGFTLVENGDVEELIIHEPLLPPPQPQLSLLKKVRDTRNLDDSGWEALDELRTDWRLNQLSQVILNHRELYDQINTQFVEKGRYYRTAGNHDQDNQDSRFLEALRRVYPKLEQVYDFLIIEPSGANDSRFVVCHGHHFDTSGTPKYSKRVGETLSECLGWAYEGADRVWRWDGLDGVQRWANGEEAFFNTLVTDDFDRLRFSFKDVVESGLATWLGTLMGGMAGLAGLGGALGMAASLADELSNPAFWETTFKHNIAWEYFQSDNAGEALFNEMFCGQRWLKVRHLDEIFINQRLESAFGSRAPFLVLGHSHEPRHRSWNPATSKQVDHYLNGGAAGRFENLIWCLEIVDGVPQVVAWHRPGGPRSNAEPERRTYTPTVSGRAGLLVPSSRHVPLPSLEKTRSRWLEPILNVMMPHAQSSAP
jgi:hypothetical protein